MVFQMCCSSNIRPTGSSPWLAFILFLFFGCVLPPSDEKPRLLKEEDLKYLKHIQDGKDYANSGRYDKAELEFLLAKRTVEKQGKQPDITLLSDIGYVLKAQSRLPEAKIYFERALERDPHFLQLRDNYARLLYESGNLTGALREYQQAETDYLDYWKSAPDKRLSLGFTGQDLLSLYVNMAIVYSQLGMQNEAICYSFNAAGLGDASYSKVNHARFLVTIEELDAAKELLKGLIAADPDPVQAATKLLDLGLVLFAAEDPLAREALDRVLEEPSVIGDERAAALLLRYSMALKEGDKETAAMIRKSSANSSETVCVGDVYHPPNFWPIRVRTEVSVKRAELCKYS